MKKLHPYTELERELNDIASLKIYMYFYLLRILRV